MKQEEKAILYSFKQLSMRYSPDLQPDSASKQLMRWVMYHPDLKQKLENAGFELVYKQPFFHEFVTTCPCDCNKLMAILAAHGILGGLPLPDGNILWCTTEKNTKSDMDELADLAGRTKA